MFSAWSCYSVVSHSWNASVPIRWVRTCPEIQTTGISPSTSVNAVTALVAPGPEVTNNTPGLPLDLITFDSRPAPCSCLVKYVLLFYDFLTRHKLEGRRHQGNQKYIQPGPLMI